jgi:fatty acid amide hydrolase
MSPLSVGTDIGGSVRVPAHYCGVAAIKPSLDRLPMRGYRSVNPGQEVVRGQAGPIARTVEDLRLLFRALDPERSSVLDARVPPFPWRDDGGASLTGLRIGVVTDDGILAASPSLLRGVDRAAAALAACGAEVRPFAFPEAPAVISSYLGALSADGGAALRRALAGGAIDPVLESMLRVGRVPATVRRAAARVAGRLGQPGVALMLEALGEKTVAALWQLTSDLRAQRQRFLSAMRAAGIALLLTPPCATPAHLHGRSRNFVLAAARSMIFNAFQMPAGVVPVTLVRESETALRTGRDLLERQAARVDRASAGLPVGVQVVGMPWQDSLVLAAMRAIEEELARDGEAPPSPVDP